MEKCSSRSSALAQFAELWRSYSLQSFRTYFSSYSWQVRATILRALAALLAAQGSGYKARQCLNDAISLYSEHNEHDYRIINTLSQIAQTYFEDNDVELAAETFKKALQQCDLESNKTITNCRFRVYADWLSVAPQNDDVRKELLSCLQSQSTSDEESIALQANAYATLTQPFLNNAFKPQHQHQTHPTHNFQYLRRAFALYEKAQLLSKASKIAVLSVNQRRASCIDDDAELVQRTIAFSATVLQGSDAAARKNMLNTVDYLVVKFAKYGNVSSAIQLANTWLLILARCPNTTFERASCKLVLADLFQHQGNLTKAKANYKYAIDTFAAIASSKKGAPLYRNKEYGPDSAIESRLKSYNRTKGGEAALLESIANLLDVPEAVQYASEEAARLRGGAIVNLALLCCKQKQLAEATKLYEELVKDKDCRQSVCDCDIAAVAVAIADAEKDNDHRVALKLYVDALDLLSERHQPKSLHKKRGNRNEDSNEEILLKNLKSFRTTDSPLSPEQNYYQWIPDSPPRQVVPTEELTSRRILEFLQAHSKELTPKKSEELAQFQQGIYEEKTQQSQSKMIEELLALVRNERSCFARLDSEFTDTIKNLDKNLKRRRELEGEVGDVATVCNEVGYELMIRGRFVQASTYLQDALSISTKAGAIAEAARGQSLAYIAQLDLEQGNFTEAEELLNKALPLRKSDTDDKLAVMRTQMLLGRLYTLTGRLSAAEAMFNSASSKMAPARVSDHTLLDMDAALSTIDGDEHAFLSRAAYRLHDVQTSRSADWQYADLLTSMSALCLAQGRFDESAKLVERAFLFRYSERFEPAKIVTRCYELLARGAIKQQKYDLANSTLDQAERIGKEELYEQHPVIAEIFCDRGDLQSALGNKSSALQSYNRAIEILQKSQIAGSSRIREIMSSMTRLQLAP